jgi:hypothetical protein
MWHQAPVKTQWGHNMVVADLAIDKDHTVSIYCEKDQTAKVEAIFTPPAAQPAPSQDIQEKCRIETVSAKGGLLHTRPATREEKIVNPGVYEVKVEQETDIEVLRQQMKGRAQFLRDRGEVKTPQLLEIASELIASPAAIRARSKFSPSKVKPSNPDPLQLSRILHELAGAASMCWNPRPAGVFDSQEAIEHVVAAIQEIRSRMDT